MNLRNRVTILVVALVVAFGFLGQARAGVLAYWEFNDREVGQTSWNGERLIDSSGNGRDAFFSQSSTFEAGAPDYGGTTALRFKADPDQVAFRDLYEGWRNEDGTSTDWPAAGEDINFDEPNSFTIEAVIKTSQAEGTGPIVSKDNSAANGEWWWLVREGVLHAFIEDETGLQGKAIGTINIADDTWHHIAMVRDAENDLLKIFVDYQLDISVPDTLMGSSANNVDIRIGRTNNGNYDFVGDIDFVRISDAALDPFGFVQKISALAPGDANRDGKVDGSDVTILAGNWQAGVGAPDPLSITWEMGDFNGDGQVDGSDVTILAGNWQHGVGAAASAVPESSMVVLILAGLGSLFFARRRWF